ncbi:MAG: glycoside hydrolase family 2 TIM barrel-domain containing protein [Pseudomonadota bacterium]
MRQTEDGWSLYRGGAPYFVRGAGGDHSIADLAAAGGNSIRTWSTDGLAAILDEAHAHGVTVTAGLWLGHERHGFDYSDPLQVAQQLQDIKADVMRYKDHPALLLWGVGNEMEGFDEGDNPAIWKAVNDIAAMIKEVDPHHPTMTVTTFVHGERIRYVHTQSPAIDIHGVNAYGGAMVLVDQLIDGGATKPFLLTEFGPVGPWEMPTTEWGAPIEQTSSEKAAFFRQSYEHSVLAAKGSALGAYAFLWGSKMEGTETWFSMFLDDGKKTAAVDTMTEIWSGAFPENRAPSVEPLVVSGPSVVDPGDIVEVSVDASDPEQGALTAQWVLRTESGEYLTGGDLRRRESAIEGAVVEARIDGAKVRMPADPGAYRLYFYAFDDANGVATANVPFLVRGEPRTRFPVVVYDEGLYDMPWSPSGWMGNVEALTVDGEFRDEPYAGDTSIRLRYAGTFGWVGVAWQHPANNWGDSDGGFDLTGAANLELWARGEYGGEKATFGVGLLEADREYPDSDIRKSDEIVLTNEWQRYTIPLKNMNLSSLKTGFVVTLTGRRTPVTIYLDQIRFIR